MLLKNTLMAAVAASVIGLTGASTAMAQDRDGRPDASWAERHDHDGFRDATHDRYWRPGFHNYVARDRIFFELRNHHYTRWIGDPYFYHSRYVVRSYDRFGHIVFVELNPYTGAFIGEVRL